MNSFAIPIGSLKELLYVKRNRIYVTGWVLAVLQGAGLFLIMLCQMFLFTLELSKSYSWFAALFSALFENRKRAISFLRELYKKSFAAAVELLRNCSVPKWNFILLLLILVNSRRATLFLIEPHKFIRSQLITLRAVLLPVL